MLVKQVPFTIIFGGTKHIHEEFGVVQQWNSYRSENPEWEVILDLDELAKQEEENWVWHGAQCLMPEEVRCIISLSRGGADADVKREFDVTTKVLLKMVSF